jgi:hypothetical protein
MCSLQIQANPTEQEVPEGVKCPDMSGFDRKN